MKNVSLLTDQLTQRTDQLISTLTKVNLLQTNCVPKSRDMVWMPSLDPRGIYLMSNEFYNKYEIIVFCSFCLEFMVLLKFYRFYDVAERKWHRPQSGMIYKFVIYLFGGSMRCLDSFLLEPFGTCIKTASTLI